MRPIEYKDALTNELVLKRFQNQFDLVRYIIQHAQEFVHAGREVPHSVDMPENLAYYLLAQVASGTESWGEQEDACQMPENGAELDAEQAEGDVGSD